MRIVQLIFRNKRVIKKLANEILFIYRHCYILKKEQHIIVYLVTETIEIVI